MMDRWIKRISGIIPHTNKNIDIELDGKNLIVTGMNGTGKTSLVRTIFEKLNAVVVQKDHSSLSETEEQLLYWENNLHSSQKGTPQYDDVIRQVNYYQNKMDAAEKGLQLVIPDSIQFSSLYDDRKAVICFFEERHFSEIAPAATAKGLSEAEEDARKQTTAQKFGNNLEQHLVNLANRRQWAKANDNDMEKTKEIDDWFIHFEQQLKRLFEDESARLKIDSNTLKYSIIQESKPPYTFQQLSAGYRAIFDIYAELLMRTEYFKITPKDLTGVILIDEIDSHLHLSLQRLILPFFIESFPKIQFIVTTHSPFVLMSTPDTMVFDLAQNEPITDDLSRYTYSAVMKGLWNIKPISASLEKDIREIAEIVNDQNKDFARLEALIEKIKNHEAALDPESKAFFLRGLEALEERGNNV
ncbi:MAG: AAA family ATPase [Treponema sp.]|jgi:predicted ATP-binding protein involved in virulence|nr:AAA family ATPase [Treponema sp.]